MSDLAASSSTPTITQLEKQIEAVTALLNPEGAVYTANLPTVQDVNGNHRPDIEHQLIEAVKAAHPAETHTLINRFWPMDEPDIVVNEEAQTADVIWGTRQFILPMNKLTTFWVESGHKVQ